MIDKKQIALESQISKYFMKDNGVTTHFYFSEVEEEKLELSVYTFNENRSTSFLFKRVKAGDKIVALSKVLKYIQEVMPEENNYTVKWRFKKDGTMQESYFRGVDPEDVINKFYDNKDRDNIIIDEVKLNPVA